MLINLKPRPRQPAGGDGAAARARRAACAGVTLYLQPTQDLTIDAETGPTAVPRVARRRRHADGHRVGAASWSQQLQRRAAGAQRRSPTPARRAWRPTSTSTATPPRACGITARADRRRALQRLRPAHRLDHLHRDQPVPRDPGGAARTRWPRRSRSASCSCAPASGEPTPLSAVATHHRAARAAADHPRGAVPGRDHRLRHRARRVARARRSTRSATRPRRSSCRPA